jgi:CSLREA domain-containing protein
MGARDIRQVAGARRPLTWLVACIGVVLTALSMPTAARAPLGRPVSLATADFNEDGIPDLLSGFGSTGGRGSGSIVLQLGNADALYPDAPAARARRASGGSSAAPFFPASQQVAVPAGADFVAAGDFDADGHADAVVAARGSDALFLVRGDGHGTFARPERADLTGAVTALGTGDVNRRDGLADLLVGIADRSGASQLLVFENGAGAWLAEPERIPLPAPAMSIAVGLLNDDAEIDLAVATGRSVVMISGRDRNAAVDGTRTTLEIGARSVVAGDFTGDDREELAVRGDDGRIRLIVGHAEGPSGQAGWQTLEVAEQPAGTAGAADTRGGGGMIAQKSGGHGKDRLRTFGGDDGVVAAIAMRANSDAQVDLVLAGASATIASSAAAVTFTVNTAADSADLVIDGACADAFGTCSLRAAIQEANATVGLDAVQFTIPGAGVPVITFLNLASLPTITQPITIDGTTQPAGMVGLNGAGLRITGGGSLIRGLAIYNRGGGFGVGAITLATNGGNVIEGNYLGLDASGATYALQFFAGVYIANSSNNIIGGTTAAARNVISNNASGGVYLDGANGAGQNQTLIQGNYIGTNITGTVDLGNALGPGITVFGTTSANTTIGGAVTGAGNVISGNGSPGSQHAGIRINQAPGTLIQGNVIGLDATGTAALGNALDGITVEFAAATTIGGTTALARNVISGNGKDGIQISHNVVITHVVQGNFVGTDATGTTAIPNLGHGIEIIGAGQHVIGGTAPGAGNVISGNGLDGMFFTNFTNLRSTNSVVQGNLIGTNATGLTAIPNVNHGIEFGLADGTLVGGTVAGARNVISGNGRDGLHFVQTNLTRIEGNYIGTDATGAGPLGNGIHGIMTGFANGDVIGGASAAAGNVIAFNAGDGVSSASVMMDAAVLSNSIFSNSGLGIDRGDNGVSANVTTRDDNAPMVTSANTTPAGTTVSGTLRNASNGAVYTVQFFTSPACDASGAGEGQQFIGETTVTSAGANVAVPFNVLLNPPVAGGSVVTAVSVGPFTGFGTERFPSEFSVCANVAASLTLLTASLPTGEVGVTYPAPPLSATGGTGSYSFTVTAGSLPNGISLLSTGAFTGPPTAAGTFNFTVQVTDGGSQPASKGFSITVLPAVAVSATPLPNGRVGVAYGSAVSSSGGSGPYTWTLVSGNPPAGLSLASTGVISGTATTIETATFTVRVTDALGGTATGTLAITILPSLAISTTSLPIGETNIPYSVQLAATGVTGTASWSLAAGALPAGLTLSTSGLIDGVPTSAGPATVTVRVTDALGNITKVLSISIAATPAITTTSLHAGQTGQNYAAVQLTLSGGVAPLTWSLSAGALPAGLTLSNGGVISGTPTVVETANFTVRVVDALGAAATQALSILVNGGPVRNPKAYVQFIDGSICPGNGYHCVPATSGVRVIDLVTNKVTKTIPLSHTFGTRFIESSPDGNRVVVVSGNDSLDVIDTNTDTIIGTVSFPLGVPGGLSISPDSSTAYLVASAPPTWSFMAIDLTTLTITASYSYPHGQPRPFSQPTCMTLSKDGSRAYITANTFDINPTNYGSLLVIDTSTGAMTAHVPLVTNAIPAAIALNPSGDQIYVSWHYSSISLGGGIMVLDAATHAVTANIPFNTSSWTFASLFVTADSQRLYVVGEAHEIGVFSTASNSLLTTIAAHDRVGAIELSPDGTSAYALTFGSKFQAPGGAFRKINMTKNSLGSPVQLGHETVGYSMAIAKGSQ